MAFAYLTEPTKQWQSIAGVNAVGGHIKVFLANTDDLATTYSDFSGTLNPAEIPIDNAGRAVIIAESSRPYRIEFYGRHGGLIFTQQPVYPMAGGGSGLTAVNVESTDGSLSVDKTVIGGAVNYDLAVAADDPQYLDWVKCIGANASGGQFIPLKADGTMAVNAYGIILRANNLYHVTARFRATKEAASPFYDKVVLAFHLWDGESNTVLHQEGRIIDYSLGLAQEFEVSADIKAPTDGTLLFGYSAEDVHAGTVEFVSTDVHRIFSGISRAAGSLVQEQADWTEANPAAPSYIKNKPQNLVQDAAYVHTDNNFTTAEKDKLSGIETGAEVNVQANWTEANTSSDAYIQNKPDIRNVPDVTANDDGKVLQAGYSGGTGSYSWQAAPPEVFTAVYGTTTYSEIEAAVTAGKLVNVVVVSGNNTSQGILKALQYTGTSNARATFVCPAITLASGSISGAVYTCKAPGTWSTAPYNQVQVDWAQTTTWELDYIKNKPNLATVATSGSYNDLSNKPTIPAAQVNSDWNASSGVSAILNKPNLATVATSGSYNDLSNKPSIPAAQVQADWTEADSAAVDYIKNKPNLATVATSGSYNDLSNKPTIPAAQVNSDWNAASGVAQILNKPSLAAVATSGAYSDLSGTPTIPAAANNGVLTITQNGTSKGTFSANQSGNNTIALTDTTYSQISRGSGAGLAPGLPSGSGTSKYLREDGMWYTPPHDTYSAGDGLSLSEMNQFSVDNPFNPNGDYSGNTLRANTAVSADYAEVAGRAPKRSNTATLYIAGTFGEGNIPYYNVKDIKNGCINYVHVQNIPSNTCSITIEAPTLASGEEYDYVVVFDTFTNSNLVGSIDVENCKKAGRFENGTFVVDSMALSSGNPRYVPMIIVTGNVASSKWYERL